MKIYFSAIFFFFFFFPPKCWKKLIWRRRADLTTILLHLSYFYSYDWVFGISLLVCSSCGICLTFWIRQDNNRCPPPRWLYSVAKTWPLSLISWNLSPWPVTCLKQMPFNTTHSRKFSPPTGKFYQSKRGNLESLHERLDILCDF